MFRDLLSNRPLQAGLVFFVCVVGASLLYSWHVHHTTDAEFAQTKAPHQRETQTETNTATETVDTRPVDFERTERPLDTEEAHTTADDRDTSTGEEEAWSPFDLTDAFLSDDFVVNEEPLEVPVSPFGFGPYPEIPPAYAARYGKTVWQYPGSLPQSNQRNIELIQRVTIAAWNQGDTRFTGATFEDGKVYLQYPNTYYVRYTVHEGADGTLHRRIREWSSGEHNPSVVDQMIEGKIPTGVILIDLDSEDVGIDPYTFLGLE